MPPLATPPVPGKLLAAGPHPALDTEEPGDAGFTGSLIIGEFDSLEAAKITFLNLVQRLAGDQLSSKEQRAS